MKFFLVLVFNTQNIQLLKQRLLLWISHRKCIFTKFLLRTVGCCGFYALHMLVTLSIAVSTGTNTLCLPKNKKGTMVNGKCNVTLGQVEMSHSNSELSWLSDVSYSAAFFYILLTLATMSYRSDQTTYGCNSLTPKLNELCWWLCLWIPLNICRKSVFFNSLI